MTHTPRTLLRVAMLTALAVTGAAHAAEGCDALRAQIESRISTAGVANFSVTVIDANAQASGQVVGSCELGTKKIVYTRGGPAPGAGGGVVPNAGAPSGSREPMLTECKDGSVLVGGNCRP